MEANLIEPSQVRAARALLDWSQERLAEAAGVSVPTVKRFEGGSGPSSSTAESVVKIRTALEAAGISFVYGITGFGVRVTSNSEEFALRMIRNLLIEQSQLFRTTLNFECRAADMEDLIRRMERLAELYDQDLEQIAGRLET